MKIEEHVYTIEVTIIGKQPKNAVRKIKRKLCADHVQIVKHQIFQHEGADDETQVPER